jgi:MFS family permease
VLVPHGQAARRHTGIEADGSPSSPVTGLSEDQSTLVTLCALIFGITLQPIYGAISDRIGRKWLLIGFGVTGVLFTVSSPLRLVIKRPRKPARR